MAPPIEPVAFKPALLLRVRIGPWAIPLWTLGVAAATGMAAVAAWVMPASTGSDEAAGAANVPAAVRPAPSAMPSPADSLPTAGATRAPATLLERATAGEREALDKLGKRPLAKRSSAESVALALGREAARLARVRQLGASLRKSAGSGISRADRAELFGLINDRQTSVVALAEVAKIEHPLGPDLLFQVWTATRERTDTTRLAEELLFSRDVRGRASPALAIVLNLRDTKDCPKTRDILASAIEHADRRSLVGLGRLQRRTGCGEGEREDCYACLRDGQAIEEAIQAAASREPPSFE